ncbi:MAG: hypothetical protein Hyperionvirus2_99 [Hyperionvirus sp.]|uniref:Ubiquitin-like domain-containing protein n=1 Tax=Hyperionvirus sp. TaxID=2487770 RepID=A0A3G5A973_9VIRU|nr:MAG: hypothetical protein Hyperionvirus2_99 [Hyperionvirus sp.]
MFKRASNTYDVSIFLIKKLKLQSYVWRIIFHVLMSFVMGDHGILLRETAAARKKATADVISSGTIQAVKDELQEKEGIPADQEPLIFEGKLGEPIPAAPTESIPAPPAEPIPAASVEPTNEEKKTINPKNKKKHLWYMKLGGVIIGLGAVAAVIASSSASDPAVDVSKSQKLKTPTPNPKTISNPKTFCFNERCG